MQSINLKDKIIYSEIDTYKEQVSLALRQLNKSIRIITSSEDNKEIIKHFLIVMSCLSDIVRDTTYINELKEGIK